MRHGVVALTLTLLLLGHATAVRGQSVADKAAAESLFREGRSLMDAGKFEQACERFASSHKLSPAVGSALNLAACESKLGRTASAWVHFTEAETLARRLGDGRREKVARERAAELQPQLPYLRLDVREAVAGLAVSRDGAPVDPALFGKDVPVDPGDHHIEASAPGRVPWSSTVSVASKSHTRLEVPPLAAPASTAAAVPAARPPVGEDNTLTATVQAQASPAPASTLKTTGWITAGVGAAALAVGAVFGVHALIKSGEAHDRCPQYDQGICTDPVGRSANDSARSSAGVSTVSLVTGGALVAAGAVMMWAGRF